MPVFWEYLPLSGHLSVEILSQFLTHAFVVTTAMEIVDTNDVKPLSSLVAVAKRRVSKTVLTLTQRLFPFRIP